ncbi:MAG: OprD family outer membrane porin [Sulfuricurvum sp.]|nr:OprD family outer membrane porin [Sulfuricurvum sp.]MDD5386239.1 OprD family outer membrane porin [Sulfuricurvum sp.]
MKLVNLSIAASVVCLLAVSAQAAEDLASAFKEGKLDGRIRLHYIGTDWDHNDDWLKGYNNTVLNKPNEDSHGAAIGGSLIYTTAPLYGVRAGAGFYTTHSLGILTNTDNGTTTGNAKNTTGSDLFARGPGAATNYGTGYSVLGQAYLQYNIAKSSVKGGRFLMSNPFISPNDTKMIPLAVEGASFVSNDIADTTIQLDYADKIKERGMTYFGSMADTGDTPDAIKNYYNTHYTAAGVSSFGQHSAPGVGILGVKNKSIKDLDLQGWYMTWPDIIDQAMAEANYKVKAGDVGLAFGARYMQQIDHGAGDIIKPMDGSSVYSSKAVTATSPTGGTSTVRLKGDNDNSVDTYMYALRAIVNYKAARFMIAYSHTASGGDLIAPWRAFPTDGYTRSMTITDWNANTKAYKGQLDYDFNSMVTGLSALVSYSYYNRDPSKVGYQGQTDRYYGNGDTHQWNADVKYAVAGIKGLELKLRTMIQKNDVVTNITGNTGGASEGVGIDTSNKEMRVEINYLF